MKLSIIPLQQIRSTADYCDGFKEVAEAFLEAGYDPDIGVIRTTLEGNSAWYLNIDCPLGCCKLIVDKANVALMATLAPIYLVDHVQSVREELPLVFQVAGFEEGVQLVVPFQSNYKGEKPS